MLPLWWKGGALALLKPELSPVNVFGIVQLLTTTLDFMATLGMQLLVPAIGILNIHMRSFEEKGFSVKSFGPRVGSWAPNVSI